MTFSDYLIDLTLIGLVLLQVKGRRLTTRALVLPLGIVAYVADQYLHGVPTGHNDLFLIVGFALIGATLGALAGKFTSVTRASDGSIMAKAGFAAAALWILGTGGRLAFQVYASHGGGPSIMHFSASHGITSAEAWTAALILMALSEVVMRTAVLALRTYTLHQDAPFASSSTTTPTSTTTPDVASSSSATSFPPVRSRTPLVSGLRSMMGSSDHPLS